MKNSRNIIEHLRSAPTYQKLNQQMVLGALRKMLPKRFGDSIIFIHQKGDTLFMALEHPGMLMELNYNLKLIKELLNIASTKYPELATIKNIKGYVKNKILDENTKNSEPRYFERSSGEFETEVENKNIEGMIKAIKEVIKSGK